MVDLIERSVPQAQRSPSHPAGRPVSVSMPPPDDAVALYNVWLSEGTDPYAHGEWPGNVDVAVNPYTAEVLTTYGRAGEPVAQTLWESWNFPVHAGVVVNGWWRLIWLVLGIVPLVLAWTGVSTWLIRRRSARNRRAVIIGSREIGAHPAPTPPPAARQPADPTDQPRDW